MFWVNNKGVVGNLLATYPGPGGGGGGSMERKSPTPTPDDEMEGLRGQQHL